MNRREQITKAAIEYHGRTPIPQSNSWSFTCGAEWADKNPISETFKYSDQQHVILEEKLKVAVEALEWYEESGSFGYYQCESMPEDYEGKDLSKPAKEALEKIKGMEK